MVITILKDVSTQAQVFRLSIFSQNCSQIVFTVVELTSSGGSGWSFGDNDGTIIINTGKMASKQWYTLMVVVSKDERIAYQELMFYVSENTVPTVYFQ